VNNGGDALARGAVRAQFGTADVTEEKWKAIFGENSKKPNVISEAEQAIYDQAMKLAEAEADKLAPAPPAKVKIRAVSDRIIVRRVEAETKVGTLFLADESVEKPAEGIVLAVGPGKWVGENFVPVTVMVDERVVFGKYSGAAVRIGVEDGLVLREEDIFFVKEN
jgi:chaperonin GroES